MVWVVELKFVLVKSMCVYLLAEVPSWFCCVSEIEGRGELLDLVLRTRFCYWCTGILCYTSRSACDSRADEHRGSVVRLNLGGRSELLGLVLRTNFYYWCTRALLVSSSPF